MKSKKLSFDDLIDRECRALATTLLEAELAKQNLPLPKDSALDIHIEQLISMDPTIRQRATLRVEARQDAYSESLRAIGITPELVQPIDIEL